MSGVTHIQIQESADELAQRLKEANQVKERLQVLYWLRQASVL